MKKLLSWGWFLCLMGALSAQDQALIILGNQVAGYAAPDLDANTFILYSSGSEVTGHRVDDDWYRVVAPGQEPSFVMAWDVIEAGIVEPVLDLNPKRITPSASTLYRMMKYFKQREKMDKAVEFALRIINGHNDEEYPTKERACYKLGHLAYMHLVSEPETGVIYDTFLFDFANKVIAESEVPAVKAMAYYHLARYQALNGAPDEAMANILAIVKDFPLAESLNECDPEDPNSAFYKPIRSKHLFCALGMIQPESALQPLRQQLADIQETTESEATRDMAEELTENLGKMPYVREESIWN